MEKKSAKKFKVSIKLGDKPSKTYYMTPHQYYAEFLLVPCWSYNSPCDICKMHKIEIIGDWRTYKHE